MNDIYILINDSNIKGFSLKSINNKYELFVPMEHGFTKFLAILLLYIQNMR